MKRPPRRIALMEVCGTHTMAIARHGLARRFPPGVVMLSGPGCPVCVTAAGDIDRAIELARVPGAVIASFGDMLRVPGSRTSLEQERASGADVRIVYSPYDALDIARRDPSRPVIFIGVGFETTIPLVAATVAAARRARVTNFFVAPLFKTLPRALSFLLEIKERRIDGLLLPGHASVIMGSRAFEYIPRQYGVPCVVGGFEPGEIIAAVDGLCAQVVWGVARVENMYPRAVSADGNSTAQDAIARVFRPCDAVWRAVGPIPKSGCAFAPSYRVFDAFKRFSIPPRTAPEPRGCKCGQILLGCAQPDECRLFGGRCTPRSPVGPCMVSSEGACAAAFKYGRLFAK